MLAEADPRRAVIVAASVASAARDRDDLVTLSRAQNRRSAYAAVHLDDLAAAART